MTLVTQGLIYIYIYIYDISNPRVKPSIAIRGKVSVSQDGSIIVVHLSKTTCLYQIFCQTCLTQQKFITESFPSLPSPKKNMYGSSCLAESNFYDSMEIFRSGRTKFTVLAWHKQCLLKESLKTTKVFTQLDGRVTVDEIVETLGLSRSFVREIIHKDLQLKYC
jgi:hypothetical protein